MLYVRTPNAIYIVDGIDESYFTTGARYYTFAQDPTKTLYIIEELRFSENLIDLLDEWVILTSPDAPKPFTISIDELALSSASLRYYLKTGARIYGSFWGTGPTLIPAAEINISDLTLKPLDIDGRIGA